MRKSLAVSVVLVGSIAEKTSSLCQFGSVKGDAQMTTVLDWSWCETDHAELAHCIHCFILTNYSIWCHCIFYSEELSTLYNQTKRKSRP